jgi:hypothetical protein
MARIFTSGFELNSLTNEVEFKNVVNSPEISSAIKRSGSYAGRVHITADESRYFQVKLADEDSNGPFFARFYVYIAQLPDGLHTIFNYQIAVSPFTQTVRIGMNTSGQLILSDEDGDIGDPSQALALNTWHRVEVHFDRQNTDGNHIVAARLNGVTFAEATNRTLTTGISYMTIGANLFNGTEATDLYFDDIAVNDGAGDDENFYPGEGRVIVMRPIGADDDSNTGLTRGGADSGSDFGQIDEVTPNDDTDYLDGGDPGEYADFRLNNPYDIGLKKSDVMKLVEAHMRGKASGVTRILPRVSTGLGLEPEKGSITFNDGVWQTNGGDTPQISPETNQIIEPFDNTDFEDDSRSHFFTDHLLANFNDNQIPSSLTNWGGAQVVAANQRLEITTTTSPGYYGVVTTAAYDFTGKVAQVKLTGVGNQALTSLEVYPIQIAEDTDNSYFFLITGNQVWAYKKIATVSEAVMEDGEAYSAVNHAYLRIREYHGQITFERSADGITWVEMATITNELDLTTAELNIFAGTYAAEGSTTTPSFDDFNIYTQVASAVWDTALGKVRMTDDYAIPVGPTNAGFNCMCGSTDGQKLYAFGTGKLYKSTDGGANWSEVTVSFNATDAACSSDGTKLVVTVRNSFVYTSTDSGANWTQRGTSRLWAQVACSDDFSQIWLGTDGAGLFRSTDEGVNITSVAGYSSSYANYVSCNSDGTKIVCANGLGASNLFTSTNTGSSFTSRTLGTGAGQIVGVVWSPDATKLWAVVGSTNYGLWRSTDDGANWTSIDNTAGNSWQLTLRIKCNTDGTILGIARGGSATHLMRKVTYDGALTIVDSRDINFFWDSGGGGCHISRDADYFFCCFVHNPIYQFGYASEEFVVSLGYDTQGSSAFPTITVSQTLNGEEIVVEYSGSNDNSTWGAWTEDYGTIRARYIRFRAYLRSPDHVGGPTIQTITIDYSALIKNYPLVLYRQPNSELDWDIDALNSLRLGIEITETNATARVSTLWAQVEYQEYTGPDTITVEIGGIDRTADMEKRTLQIVDEINEKANNASFRLFDNHGYGPPETDDVIEIRTNGVLDFAGLVTRVGYEQLSNDVDVYSVEAVDYTRILDRRLVAATYQNMTDKEIIETIIEEFAFDEGISTFNVSEGVTVNQISFNYVPVSQAISEIATLTGRNWYIDYQKDIHYFPVTQNQAPFQLTSDGSYHENLTITKDSTRLRNRVFVRGGTELTTEPITETVIADGEQRQFLLAEKPHDLTITHEGNPQTVGIKNIDNPDDFDFMMNFQEKYIECGTNKTTPLNGDEIACTYNYDVPILVSVEDGQSILESGVYEHVIIDRQIGSTQQARDRAIADLTDYAQQIVDGQYKTFFAGLRSGQYQRVTMANKDIDEDYLITKVSARSIGAPVLQYTVYLSSAKTLGIIKFLIDLLRVNRSVGEFDPNEKVDQLFSLADTLDSLTDSLTIDSYGLTFSWAPDTAGVTGALQWDLGQWAPD